MFERSLLDSPPALRWTTFVSLSLQCALVAAILAIPLLHPASILFHSDAPKLFLPIRPAPLPKPRIITTRDATTATPAPAASSAAPAGHQFILTHMPVQGEADAPPNLNPVGRMGSGDGTDPGAAIATSGSHSGPGISVIAAKPAAPLRISTGVSTGLLLSPIKPVYPRMAVATRAEGVVIVEAIISKSGQIESAHATSGPALLREAAIDAIRNARYSPYLLNGTPTEVQTTITVTFRLAG